MATAKTETGLALDTFAKILGIHPLHFNQIAIERVSGCGEVYLQYDWQMPSVISRESIAQAIGQAEMLLEEFLGFPVYPKWYSNIKLPLTGTPVVLPKAHYITGGIKRVSLIEDDVPITYTDKDSDTYFETATIQVAVSPGVALDELVVTYPGEFDGWQIRPISVSEDAGIVTIVLNRYDLVIKDELEALIPSRIDGLDDTKFLELVDVYRVYNDPSVQGELHSTCTVCGTLGTCLTCQFKVYTACLKAEDHKASIIQVQPALWDTETLAWSKTHCVEPIYDSLMWFKAGWTGPNIWDTAVTYLALTLIPMGLCGCPTVKEKIEWWTTDMSKSDRTATYKVPDAAKDCPWGYTKGAMYAFSIARRHKMPQGL